MKDVLRTMLECTMSIHGYCLKYSNLKLSIWWVKVSQAPNITIISCRNIGRYKRS